MGPTQRVECAAMSTQKLIARERLAQVLEDYERVRASGALAVETEATARSWIERCLVALGWDPSDPREVVQEWTIRGRDALRFIKDPDGPSHNRPDYGLVVHRRPIAFLDAKRLGADLSDDYGVSFQVRSYGWSNGLRVSYAFNVEQFAVWDTRFMPRQTDTDAAFTRVLFLKRAEFLTRFDDLWDYLGRDAVLAGSIYRRHPENRRTQDMKPLDVDFEERLTRWRLEIARSILKYGKRSHEDIAKKPEIVSIATQRIIDRIVFLRFCEQMGLEDHGTLQSFSGSELGFWHDFMKEHDRYRREYDGILFPSSNESDPTGVEEYINDWWLEGGFWKTIQFDLYQAGYRFETIPLELIGGMYERFLGKRLTISGSQVRDDYKPEYQQTKGAVYTPPWIVQRVLDKTLGPLAQGLAPEQIFALRIVDPSCGSGSFLLGTFDWIEARLLDWVRGHPADPQVPELAAPQGTDWRLLPSAVRRIIDECLHGVDIDTEAVEVARMSLALRFLERAAPELGEAPKELLKGIGRNIRQGNSLVGMDALERGLDAAAMARVRAFDWRSVTTGFGRVFERGGFDAVVGNPPYIEVKRYKEWLPEQYAYLKSKPPPFETAAEGKTDISVPFMEKGITLLRPGGRLGFIVQNRFFKTDYGETARAWMLRDALLEDVEDFRDLQVFEGRTTYTAILTLSRQPNARFRYRCFETLITARAGIAEIDTRYARGAVGSGVWALDAPELLELHRTLAKRHGTIGDHKSLSIGVGLQVLWSKGYMFDAVAVGPRVVRARAWTGEEFSFERAVVRPLCRNAGFYPFRRDNADKWVLFPYEVTGDDFREIGWKELKERFPGAKSFLETHQRQIKAAVTTNEERDRWHLYTWPKNIVAQARPKVLFPSTAEDTMAAVDPVGNLYQDNVRICSLQVLNAKVELGALAAVMNSSVFNTLVKLKAGLSDGGWKQFNKQFMSLVPFPLKRLKGEAAARLTRLGASIEDAQHTMVSDRSDEGGRQALRSVLDDLWRQLDEAVEELYDLSAGERDLVRRYPRRVDRVDLLLRQTASPVEPEPEE